MSVGIIDYGKGNLGSMVRAVQELKGKPILLSRPDQIVSAGRLILPGVGNFTDCMGMLESGGWIEPLRAAVMEKGVPLLGVCVGMQLLATGGDEGADPSVPDGTPGLGFIPGRVVHLRQLGCTGRIPHVGWNAVSTPGARTTLFRGIPDRTDFYFVHSYGFAVDQPDDAIAVSNYGENFAAAVHRGNVWGTQFHPEKSSRAGFALLRNFIEMAPC